MNKVVTKLRRSAKVALIVVSKALSILIPFKRRACTANSTRCEYDFFNHNYRNAWFGKNSAVCCNTHLYHLLRDLTACLEEAGIPYFIFYGTLLGAIRHNGGFVPWDTDVDICLLESDRSRCKLLIDEKLGRRYPISDINEFWSMLDYSERNKVHADLYFMTVEDEFMYLKGYESIRYPIAEIFPLRKISLYDLELSAPQDPRAIRHKYGENMMNHAFRQYALWQKKTREFVAAKINE